ncbi:hypothetical protein [Burkholderia pseudomallei]|uniref:hypothetical protein n=1 Tax=Burkholderia pseudomallei TaxID=28450 RepID=UPI000F2B47FE|nr:hypothetical protein [Burkholderia pseudomallei]CAJ2721569.1 Uncharacterised protein [Burkholderia pseudomallei]VBX79612.1 Uncharacterised protein [Burkholderia pseudomallei]VBX79649.1 Uncharacterised protein [Burkholderia pseudomallei]VBX89062.1 Uncharacterised protein [Burkholderia pseudomallei]VBX90832.1 Uncharacterised protein [Burkholderia pseudomallei]
MVDRKDLAEVEPIVAQWIRERGTMMDGASYAAALELAAYVAARRTTPDREAIIEECAKVCDEDADDKWNLYKGQHPYTGRESGRADPYVEGRADGASVCADRIRALKTVPTSDKGGA